MLLHHPRLHGRGVGAEQHLGRRDVQCVPHIPRRMVGGDVEHLEVVLVQLDLWSFDDLIPDGLEEAGDLSQDDGGRVESSPHHWPAWQRHVDALGVQRLRERGLTAAAQVRLEGRFECFLRLVGSLPGSRTLVGRQPGQAAQHIG